MQESKQFCKRATTKTNVIGLFFGCSKRSHKLIISRENSFLSLNAGATRPARPLPAGSRITEVYNDADGELLILGEPSAGKTTLLLELTRDLLDRAELKDSLNR